MHFFKYGNEGVLAIVLPPRLQKTSGVRDGDAYEFVELSQGVFVMCRKDLLPSLPQLIGQKLLDVERPIRRKGEGDDEVVGPQAVYKPAAAVSKPVVVAEAEPQRAVMSPAEELDQYGYIVCPDEESAKLLSKSLEESIRRGLVAGVRGFDKKFYVVSKPFLDNVGARIREACGAGEFTIPQASAKVRESLNAAKSVVQVLKDQGELIEKRTGVYKFV